MFAKHLFVDDLNVPREQRSSRPSAESIEAAIRRLDSKFVRNVILAHGPPAAGDDYPFAGTAISVSGSNDRYVVEYCTDDGGVKYLLRDGAELGLGKSPVMRGQVIDFGNALLVPLDDVLRIASEFYETGRLACAHRWISWDA